MARILAIDYGKKRSGIAVTDTLQISANGLPTLETKLLMDWIKNYVTTESVEKILVGEPRQTNGLPSENMKRIIPFVQRLKKALPDIPVELVDERFTSVIAHREMLAAGFKKSDRQKKGLADEMSAVIILTSYLESKH